MPRPTDYKPSDLIELREAYQSLRGVEKKQVREFVYSQLAFAKAVEAYQSLGPEEQDEIAETLELLAK